MLPIRLRKRRGIDVDTLIQEVQNREPLWNMADRRHADQFITRRLWEEVCGAVLENWEELDAGAQDLARNRVIVRWRSLRDRFKREFNKEMQALSGSRGRRSRYKYARALSFLRSTLLSRSTVCSTREPASELHPSGAISQESTTGDHVERPDPSVSVPSLLFDPSAPSTSAGAAGQTLSHEAAGDVEFPLPHPSDTAATSRTPLGSGRQRQRGQERSYVPEFLHLNAAFQNAMKLLGEQTSVGTMYFVKIGAGLTARGFFLSVALTSQSESIWKAIPYEKLPRNLRFPTMVSITHFRGEHKQALTT
ncbi:uncharacterized protein LOC143796079 [Ranitomeya variabilis]|uniref:uncharacterized protein LOC143796079 n=1 Tax=Ranitomeya variabilis TaxID=490064 RepID=UPI0040571FD9